MAELRFDILADQGEVSAPTFKNSIEYAVSLLREFDSALSGKPRGVLRWYVHNLRSNGSLSVVFHSRVKPYSQIIKYPTDVDRSVASYFVNGFENIEVKCETPQYLSEFGLQKVNKLAHLIGKDGPKSFHFQTQEKGVEVTRKTQENIRKLLPIAHKDIGSVEGTLEIINLHNVPKCIVYDAVSKKGVTCLFDEREYMDQVKASLGQRVIIFGELFKNVKGDTLRVAMREIRTVDMAQRFRLPSEEVLQEPDFAKVRGTKEYLRNIRGR